MANSASDARHSEADIRRNLIKSGVIDCMLTLPKNMIYTVTLPATLWFFDKSKTGTEPRVLFIDARNIFRQVTRALREFTEEQIQNIAAIVRLYRGETDRFKKLGESYRQKAADYEKKAADAWPAVDAADTECEAAQEKWNRLRQEAKGDKSLQAELTRITRELNTNCKRRDEVKKAYRELIEKQRYYEQQAEWLTSRFPAGVYEDVTGLCKAATLKEIEEQDWSLNPGRYVGVVIEEDGLTEEEFLREMKERHKTLEGLNKEAANLEALISKNLSAINGKLKPCKLGEIITLKRGYDLPDRVRRKGSYAVVSSSGVSDFHNDYKVKPPCVATGRYGTLGEIHFVNQKCWPLNTTLYVKDFKGNDPKFIYYFLKTLRLLFS